ncbi:MAG: HEPN domain-containing protein [Candidatus Methanogaster sp.]|uniref:HEPN domain-containing protein n=1 Tax=Candidatus Methanogaster sp. TaxID=3386292 RepID=A0AC61KZZ0_9EURY|nr:MAG: HEPN domain-containing protein [ANME-2 cluster archaeon]
MENAHRSIELSASNIEDADENLRIHRYRVVIVSSYTAMFHAARALLFKDGIKERSHECVPKYLKEKYKDMGMYANVLDTYRRFRHSAIYGLDVVLDEDEARTALNSAKEFLSIVERII